MSFGEKTPLIRKIYYGITLPIRIMVVIVWIFLTISEDDYPMES